VSKKTDRLKFTLHSAVDKLIDNLDNSLPEFYGEKCTEFNGKVVNHLRDFLTVEAIKIKERRDASGN
jgi:hypothetical protein